jgi:arsenate reductase
MSKLKVYEYAGCDTCRKARKYLQRNGIDHQLVPIRDQPPTKAELRRVLANYDGNVKKLFNTSGGDYRVAKLGEKLPGMSTAEAIELLASNGNLVKRPFVPTPEGGLVGFREEQWDKALK